MKGTREFLLSEKIKIHFQAQILKKTTQASKNSSEKHSTKASKKSSETNSIKVSKTSTKKNSAQASKNASEETQVNKNASKKQLNLAKPHSRNTLLLLSVIQPKLDMRHDTKLR